MNPPYALFSFHGRLRRREWWLWSIVTGLGYLFAHLIAMRLFFPDSGFQSLEMYPVIGDPAGPVLVSATILAPFTWVHCALAAKRAHDRNHRAWLVIVLQLGSLVSSFLPVDPMAVASYRPMTTADMIMTGFSALMLVASLYLLVVLGFLDGTRGPNRFGPSPKGIGGDMPDVTARVFD